jgi:hypothetical protein
MQKFAEMAGFFQNSGQEFRLLTVYTQNIPGIDEVVLWDLEEQAILDCEIFRTRNLARFT